MAFRVGLIFAPSLGEAPSVPPVAALLGEIDKRTAEVRSGESITLVPFVRTNGEVALAAALAGSKYPAEAATWSDAGVLFDSLDALAKFPRPPREARLDVDRAMDAILSLCHVVVLVCGSREEFDSAAKLLSEHRNTWQLVALVSVADGAKRFYQTNSPPDLSGTDWYLSVEERWRNARPAIDALPAEKRESLGLLFPWLVSAVIRRRFENVKRKKRSEPERCRSGMGVSELAMKKLVAGDRPLLDANMDMLCPFFVRHDELGRYYSNVFRTTCLLVPLLIAASTVLAVAAVIQHEHRDLWHVVEGVLLLLAAGFVWRASRSAYHAGWVEHRLTTELMRSAMMCNLLHTAPRLTQPTESPDQWVHQTQVVWTYLRSLPAVAFTTASADLLSSRLSAVTHYAKHQEDFHRDFAKQHRDAQGLLVWVTGRAFLITLVVAAAQLAIAHFAEAKGDWPVKLMMVTLVCASGAFVVSLLAHQLGFESIAERSANAEQRFRSLRESMERSGHSADSGKVYAWAGECAQIIVDEQHSWYRQIPLLRLDL